MSQRCFSIHECYFSLWPSRSNKLSSMAPHFANVATFGGLTKDALIELPRLPRVEVPEADASHVTAMIYERTWRRTSRVFFFFLLIWMLSQISKAQMLLQSAASLERDSNKLESIHHVWVWLNLPPTLSWFSLNKFTMQQAWPRVK